MLIVLQVPRCSGCPVRDACRESRNPLRLRSVSLRDNYRNRTVAMSIVDNASPPSTAAGLPSTAATTDRCQLIALKEWAPICAALSSGEQTVWILCCCSHCCILRVATPAPAFHPLMMPARPCLHWSRSCCAKVVSANRHLCPPLAPSSFSQRRSTLRHSCSSQRHGKGEQEQLFVPITKGCAKAASLSGLPSQVCRRTGF